MTRHSRPNPFASRTPFRRAEPSTPTEAWLFARAILGRPLPDPRRAARQAQTERDELERLTPFVPRCAEQLRELERAEASARRHRESLAWAAGISHEAEATLRGLLREESAAAEAQQRWERQFEAQWAAISEQVPWREEDHPRTPAGRPEGGQWVEKGAGGGAGQAQNRAKPRIQMASFKAADSKADSEAVWRGAIIVAGNLDLPTGFLVWNASREITVKKGQLPKFEAGTVVLDTLVTTRLERIGKAGRYDPAMDKAAMGSVYNEAFHAWFSGNRKSLGWLLSIMKSQQQFGRQLEVKAEEAMSECINQVINELEDGRTILTYDRVMQLKPTDSWRQNLTPGHNEPGQKYWWFPAGSEKEMNEDLYYATIWVLYNGRRDPAPGSGNRLTAMKKFFAQKFHPDWTPQEVQQFADSRYGED